MMSIPPRGILWAEGGPGNLWPGLPAAEKILKVSNFAMHNHHESVRNLSEVGGIKYGSHKLWKRRLNCFHRQRLRMAHEKFICQRRG